MTIRRLLLLSTLALAPSCGTPVGPEPENEAILGNWVRARMGATEVLSRADTLADDNFGYAIKDNGTFIQRDPGWCLTPPLSFANREGTWTWAADSTLEVEMDWWDGKPRKYYLHILRVDDDSLEVRAEYP